MAQFNLGVNSFLAGELSPKMYGRTELQQYFQGAEELYNQLVYVQGGAYRRPGSQFMNIVDNDNVWNYVTNTATYFRAIPYTSSSGGRYILVIAPGIIGPTRWGMINLSNNICFGISYTTNFNYALTYTEQDIRDIKYAQIGDYLVLTTPNHPPKFVYYGSNTVWGGTQNYFASDFNETVFPATTSVTSFAKCMPFLTLNAANNQNQGSLTASATTGNITLTSSASIFNQNWEGTFIKLSSGGSTGFVEITSYTNASTVSATVYKTVPTAACGITAGTSWEEAAWSPKNGWPRAVAGYQQRIFYGGTLRQPDTVWATEQGDVFELMERRFEQDPNFLAALSNDRPFSFTIASTEVNTIQWLAAGKALMIGTNGREHVAQGTNGALGPLDISVSSESSYGSSYSQPVRYDSALYYCQRSGQSLRELVFNLDENAYKGNNILQMADHIVNKSSTKHAVFSTPKILELQVQMTENPIIWAIDNNGGLIGGVIDRSNNVVAWTYHEIGGSLSGEKTKILSIASVIAQNGQSDDLYMVVRRTVDGTTKNYLEKISRDWNLNTIFNSSTSLDDKMLYMDCARLQRLGSPGTSFNAFTHLPNTEVEVIADGVYIGKKTVSNTGVITLTSNATEVYAGLEYKSRIKLLNLEPGSQVGSSQGQFIKVHHLLLRFYRTLAAKFGKSLSDLESVPFDSSSVLYTGDKRVTLHPGYERSTSIYIESSGPLPMSISCVVADGMTNV